MVFTEYFCRIDQLMKQGDNGYLSTHEPCACCCRGIPHSAKATCFLNKDWDRSKRLQIAVNETLKENASVFFAPVSSRKGRKSPSPSSDDRKDPGFPLSLKQEIKARKESIQKRAFEPSPFGPGLRKSSSNPHHIFNLYPNSHPAQRLVLSVQDVSQTQKRHG